MAALNGKEMIMRRLFKSLLFPVPLLACLILTGCSGSVGVGMSVGVPVGNHGYISIGGGRWR